MSLTTDRNNPCLKETHTEGHLKGQQKCYLVLSEEERAKGFVRPVRTKYIHVGIRPKFPLRELTQEEHDRYDKFGYVKFEEYPESVNMGLGRYWTEKTLNSGCQSSTTMGTALAETWARDPKFYGGTFCCYCGKHFPVEEFIWEDGERLGT